MPDAAELILRLGHKEPALETALEQVAVVPGMQPILARFGDDSDVNVAVRAIRHLAMYYCVLHARAAEFHVTRSFDRDARAIAFKLQVGEDSHTAITDGPMPKGSPVTWRDARLPGYAP